MPHPSVSSLLRHAARAFAVVCAAAGAAAAQSLRGGLVYTGPGGAIRDNQVITFTFTVDALGVLPTDGGLTVRFRDLVDPLAGDLAAVLRYTAPGQSTPTLSVRLFNTAPAGFNDRAFDGSYSFGSVFTAPLPGGSVTPGDYASVETLSGAFVGRPIAGTYQVEVSDVFSNGGATVGGVDLGFDLRTTSTVPEPGTVALVGAGLLAVGGLAERRARAAG